MIGLRVLRRVFVYALATDMRKSFDTLGGFARDARRWWKNSATLINVACPIHYFDELGVPRLAT